MKTGRNLQAEALIAIILKKELILDVFQNGRVYAITPKGRAYVRHIEETQQ